MPRSAHKRLLLIGDERKGGSKALIQHHATWLTGRGCHCEIVMDRDQPLQDRDADCVVVFGGDGSLLSAARRMGQNQRPTLGINRGRLGFLTSFEYEHTQRALDMLLAGELREEQRLMFWCSVVAPDGVTTTPVLGLNDVVVSRAAVGGMIALRALRGSAWLATYRG